MELKCEKCGLNLGDMEKGKVRRRAVMLCGACWAKASVAMEVAEMARDGMKELGVVNDLFKEFGR